MFWNRKENVSVSWGPRDQLKLLIVEILRYSGCYLSDVKNKHYYRDSIVISFVPVSFYFSLSYGGDSYYLYKIAISGEETTLDSSIEFNAK